MPFFGPAIDSPALDAAFFGRSAAQLRAMGVTPFADSARTPRNNRIAILGPSHASFHFANYAPGDTANTAAFSTGSAQGPVNWANFLSGGRAVCEAADCFGYIGDLSSTGTNSGGNAVPGITSRVDAAIASGAGHVAVIGVQANDRGVSAFSAATTIANIDTIMAKIAAAGLPCTFILDFPHGDNTNTGFTLSNAAGAPQLEWWTKVNRYVMQTYHGRNGVRVIDAPAVLADFAQTNGRALAGMLVDGLHLSQIGAYAVGRVLAREWQRMYPATSGLPFSNSDPVNTNGGNDVPLQSVNPYFSGTGGTLGSNGSGTIADSWTFFGGSGLTGTLSKVTTTSFNGRSYIDGDGPMSKDWQQIALGGTASATANVFLLRQSVTCTAGDILRMAAELEIDAGVTGVSMIGLYAFESAGNAPAYSIAGQLLTPTTFNSIVFPNFALSGVARSPRWANVSAQYNIGLQARTINGAAISGTIRVRGFGAGKALV